MKHSFIIVNGTLQQADEPVITGNNRGLMYGDGCFETCCAYKGYFFRLDDHLSRLKKGLNYLGIRYPVDLQNDTVSDLLEQLLSKNKLLNRKAIIRMQVWRQGARGYATSSTASGYMVSATPCPSPQKAYTLRTVSTKRIPSEALPSTYKFTNGINYIKAGNQAQQQGGDDALMQTVQGWVSETTVANIFWVMDDEVYTPSERCDILPGITRNTVINLLKNKLEMNVYEGEFNLQAIKQAEYAWICNSVKEIAPIARIDETTFHSNAPIIDSVQLAYQSLLKQELQGVI